MPGSLLLHVHLWKCVYMREMQFFVTNKMQQCDSLDCTASTTHTCLALRFQLYGTKSCGKEKRTRWVNVRFLEEKKMIYDEIGLMTLIDFILFLFIHKWWIANMNEWVFIYTFQIVRSKKWRDNFFFFFNIWKAMMISIILLQKLLCAAIIYTWKPARGDVHEISKPDRHFCPIGAYILRKLEKLIKISRQKLFWLIYFYQTHTWTLDRDSPTCPRTVK